MQFSPLQKPGFLRGVTSLAVALISLSASTALADRSSIVAPGSAFYKVWEKENLEGDFIGAAEEYEVLYRRPGLASGADTSQASSAQLDRIRAAYRAGLCFEAVENLNRARFAYQWIERNYSRIRIDLLLEFPANTELQDFLTLLRERSSLRFSKLKATEAESEIERVAIAEVLEEFSEYNRIGASSRESYRQLLRELRGRVAAADELAAELELGGVSGSFSDRLDIAGVGGQELRSMIEELQKGLPLLGEEKPYNLLGYLRSCFLQRALDALSLEETDNAGRELSVALAIDPDFVPALSLRALLAGRGSASFLAASAKRFTARQQGLRAGRVRRATRRLVSEAESLDRRDRVLTELFRANRICCSESVDVLADEEVSRLSYRIRLGCIERAGQLKTREVEDVLATERGRIRSSLDDYEELVSLFSRILLQRNFLAGGGLDRESLVAAVVGIAQEIKNETRVERVRADRLRLERLEFKLALLERWFPEIKELIKAI